MFSRAVKDKEPFPVSAVAGGDVEKRAPRQLEFLYHAIVAAPEMFPWAFSRRKIAPVEGLAPGSSPTGTPNQCWLSVDLYLTLAALAHRAGRPRRGRGVFEMPARGCPEIIAVGAAAAMAEGRRAPLPRGGLRRRASPVPRVARAPVGSRRVTSGVGVGSKRAGVRGEGDGGDARQGGRRSRPAHAGRVPGSKGAVRGFGRAPTGRRRTPVGGGGSTSTWRSGCRRGARRRGRSSSAASDSSMRATGADESPGAPKLAETAAVFFKVLQAGAGGLPPELQTELRAAMSEAAAANPTLAGAVAAVGAGGAANPANPGGEAGGGGGFPADVEAEANSYFQRLYSGQHTVEQTVDMLTRFRVADREGRDISGHGPQPLDEYRFFPKYPEKELRITAVLFGRLINHQLVVSMTLGVALRASWTRCASLSATRCSRSAARRSSSSSSAPGGRSFANT